MDENAIEDTSQDSRNIYPPTVGQLEKKGKLRSCRSLISGDNQGGVPFDPLNTGRKGGKGNRGHLAADEKTYC